MGQEIRTTESHQRVPPPSRTERRCHDGPDQDHPRRVRTASPVVQHRPGSALPAASAAAPGHAAAGRPRGPGPAVPDGADRPGGDRRSYVPIPEEVLDVYKLWRPTPLFRAHRLEKALEYSGPHLLQVRGRFPGWVAQAQHRRAAGVLQRRRRHPPSHHRDRRRSVGERAGLRLGPVRAGVRGLDGARLLRPEALPARADGNLRRHRARQPEPAHHRGQQDPGR